MYDLDVDGPAPNRCQVRAWRPTVPGIAEVFHGRIVDYRYPPHCHDTWTVLIVDSGAIRYDLDTHRCGAAGDTVAILPPGAVHDGRPADGAVHGFTKRNLYLEADTIPMSLIGAAVDHTNLRDGELRSAIVGLHDAIVAGEGGLDGEVRLAMIVERITDHLLAHAVPTPAPESGAADQLRAFLDQHTVGSVTLIDAAAQIDRSVPHLVRSFTQAFGVSPHAYVVGRRVEAARRLLLQGEPPAAVAVAVGFHDQAHLTRHFKRHTSVPPARYAASGA